MWTSQVGLEEQREWGEGISKTKGPLWVSFLLRPVDYCEWLALLVGGGTRQATAVVDRDGMEQVFRPDLVSTV